MNVEIKRMNLEDLTPADYNPRKISEKAFEGLGNSLSRFGILAHIVWNKRTGNIVGGHQRYEQLIQKGEIEADVLVVDLDDNEEVALNITLNNPGIRGDFTREVMDQLRMSEAQIGSAFNQIGLMDLYEALEERGLDKKPKEKKTREKKEDSVPNIEESAPKDVNRDKGNKAQAVITCPKCKSQWNLTDNAVVYNSVTATGKSVGGGK